MTKFSLRVRLVAVVVAVVAFALASGGVATWFALQAFLLHRLDDQLEQVADGTQGALARGERVVVPPRRPGPDGRGSALTPLVAVVDSEGTVRQNAPTAAEELVLSANDIQRLVDNPNVAQNLTTSDGENVRAESRTLPGDLLLVIALPSGDVESTLDRLLLVELAVGGAAVLAAAVLGTYGVRVGLRPLSRVTETAGSVATDLSDHGHGLDRRVPKGAPSTEVGQLAEAVNTMLEAVQEEFEARAASESRMRRFLADASHELRTPLTSLRGYAELERLREAGGKADPAATSDALRRIETEADRMARLVDDLLMLARTDRDAVTAKVTVPVDELIGEAVERARAANPGRRFVVDANGAGLELIGDQEALLQVLGNLLRNAAVHTPGPAPVRIGAHRDGREMVLVIADAGPGMSPEQAAHAFDRFWRADTGRSRATGGSGLGLAIVQSLVMVQGGSVSLSSAVDSGTTVTIRMPAV